MNALKFIKLYLFCSLIGAACLMIYAYPLWPKTLVGWVSLLVLGLPILLMGESIGNFIADNKMSRAIEANTKDKRISWKRVLYFVITWGIAILLIVFICSNIEGGIVGEFVEKNFKI